MTLSVHDAAREHPDRIALVSDAGALTYAGLARMVARARGWLDANGFSASSAPLAFVARRSLDDVALFFAAIERGVPIVPLHVRHSAVERDACARAAGATWLVDDAAALDLGACSPAPPTRADLDPERPLAIIATSGTTASPRAAILSRRAFVASARASASVLGFHASDRWLVSLPLAHVGGAAILVRALLARGAVVLAPEGSWDARATVERMERARATIASFVPTMLARALDARSTARAPASLRAVLVGGERVDPSLLEGARAAGWRFRPTYGLTEACSQVATAPDARARGAEGTEGGVGPPLPGIGVRIAEGAIEVSGPTLFSGYAGGPCVAPDTWWRTNDRGFLDDDGFVHVTGRAEELIVSGGENVSALEVESALLADPRVVRACVVGVPDAELGQLVAAALVLGASVPLEELDGLARERLAGFKVPRRWGVMSRLPATITGKIDRREVARVMSQQVGVLAHQRMSDVYPRSGEKRVHG